MLATKFREDITTKPQNVGTAVLLSPLFNAIVVSRSIMLHRCPVYDA
jgi:hypothetical protein